jgi:deoxyribodipyrimidine photo-lyase
MLSGLQEAVRGLQEKGIGFELLTGDPVKEFPRLVRRLKAGALVADFDPLKIKRKWRDGVAGIVGIPVYEVDAHNIVPCRYVSGKQEFAARTLRPKIHRSLPEFLESFPNLKKHPYPCKEGTRAELDKKKLLSGLKLDHSVPIVESFTPGRRAARRTMRRFLERGLERYDSDSNDPNEGAESGLSPYLHFGQISAQSIALAVEEADVPSEDRDAFLEQLIVRKELSDNFCYYNEKYDSTECFPSWALNTLREHRNDRREYNYDRDTLEKAGTHDRLWNAAQTEMVLTGKMHGYMRMYWAKKILEWTSSAKEALAAIIYLNDRYELDGRDPNGYAGAAWSVGGVHDRPWKERAVYGKIRYMSYGGARSKFDIEEYITMQQNRQTRM